MAPRRRAQAAPTAAPEPAAAPEPDLNERGVTFVRGFDACRATCEFELGQGILLKTRGQNNQVLRILHTI